MPNEEDYLDGLLNSITKARNEADSAADDAARKQAASIARRNRIRPEDDFMEAAGLNDYQPHQMTHRNLHRALSESDFLKDFENELENGDPDAFVENFETELDLEDADSLGSLEQSIFSNADSVGSGEEQKIQHDDVPSSEEASSQAADSSTDAESSLNSEHSSEPKAAAEPYLAADELPETDTVSPGTFGTADADADAAVSDNAADDFLPESAGSPDELLSSIENIVTNAKKQVTGSDIPPSTPNDDIPGIEPSNDAADESPSADESSIPEEFAPDELDLSATPLAEGHTEAQEVPLMDDHPEQADLLDMLASDDQFMDLGEMLQADENEEVLPDAEKSFEESAEAVTPSSEDSFADSGDEISVDDLEAPKGGFFARIAAGLKKLFSRNKSSEEDADQAQGEAVVIGENTAPTAEELVAEDNDILNQLAEEEKNSAQDAGDTGPLDEEDEEQPPKEEKKPGLFARLKEKRSARPPKEPDTSPVIPVKTIAVFVVLAISISAFLIIFINNYSYRTSLQDAQSAYDKQDYVTAYEDFAGMNLKESDASMLDKSRLLAVLQIKMNEYSFCMNRKSYLQALDSLIEGTYAYENSKSAASDLGISDLYQSLGNQMEQQLYDQFGINPEKAVDLYKLKSRNHYTLSLEEILEEQGLSDNDEGTSS